MEKNPNKRQLQYSQTLEAIRAAVDKLVDEVGFDAMRIQDICREVGISPGAFYHYFSSKSDVFIDRFRRRNAYYRNLYESTLRHMHAVDALKQLIQELLDYIPSRVPGILRNYAKALIDEYDRWVLDDGDAVIDVATALAQRGIETGTLRTSYCAADIAMVLNDYYRGIMISESVQPGTPEHYTTRAHIFFDWLESLRAPQ